ncbi:MAG: S1C family serine protease [Deltaproteobacteria bacterium]|nr:S1C family serine protease [Deltaproteobacteria bacterium]
MNASLSLLQSVLPASVGLRVKIPDAHPSAQILGTDRMGSGVLVDPSGIILTVNYIGLGAETVEVTLLDETRLAGQVIAQDFYSGLSAVKVPGTGYPAVRPGSSESLQVGQEVFLLASAGGSQRRVNNGGISSLGPFDAFWEFRLERAIVTTAMNPGLGGGGLFTNTGALVGVVSLDLNEVGRFTLAIPSEHWFAHRDELLREGRRTSRPARAWVGFYCYTLREHVVVAGVLPGTPGERGGLRPGDVIVSIDDQEIASRADLYARLWTHRPGDSIRFHVFRDDSVRQVTVESTDAETFFA